MLLIQSVSLNWSKAGRGGPFAEARRRFPQAFPLEALPAGEAVLHTLCFYQQGTEFVDDLTENRQSLERFLPKLDFPPERVQQEIQKRARAIRQYRTQVFASVSALNLTNLAVRPSEDGYAVSFFYDRHRCGAPYRRGRNQYYADPLSLFYGKDCLNEPAFRLAPGQYGRVLWNERRTDCDTGQWSYFLHIENLYCTTGPPTEDLLAAREPDFFYHQLAELY